MFLFGKNEMTAANDYKIPEVDLSVMPKDLPEKYHYLYEYSVVDDGRDYMAHPDSVLLRNNDILTMYPAGHGKGAVLNKVSKDRGLTYNSCIENTPKSWEKSLETPTVYRLEFKDGSEKLILISANSKWLACPLQRASIAQFQRMRVKHGLSLKPSMIKTTLIFKLSQSLQWLRLPALRKTANLLINGWDFSTIQNSIIIKQF